MIEIPRLRAVTYLRPLPTGRTCPSVFQCVDSGDYSAEYAVKPQSQLGTRVVCEALAALVGRQLGLPIPPIAAVEVHPRLIDAIIDADTRQKFVGPVSNHFGSLFQSPGFTTIPKGLRLPTTMQEMATKIFAFDMLIQNPDRTNINGRGKPNTLWDGDRLVIIDHDLAFSFLSEIGGVADPLPWELRQLKFARYHLFYDDVVRYVERNKGISFDGFLQDVAGLSDEVFDSMVGNLPSDWLNLDHVRKIVTYLKRARDNVEQVDQGLREVLI